MNLKSAINRAIGNAWAWWTFFRCVPHYVVAACRQATGRWYFLRDRPQWFVDLFAAMTPDGSEDEHFSAILVEAKAEQLRRLRAKGSAS